MASNGEAGHSEGSLSFDNVCTDAPIYAECSRMLVSWSANQSQMNLARSNLRHSAINVDALRQGFCLRIKDSLNQELLWNVINRFGIQKSRIFPPCLSV